MESLKMDILTPESRFNGEMVSQIAFLRSNQNDLESCIRKQDEVIRKLADDNQFLTSMLRSCEKLTCRVLENTSLTNTPSHNSVDDIHTSVVNILANESDSIMSNDCPVSSQSSCLTQDQNIASNQDITLQSEIHLTQPVHDIYPDLSLGSVLD